MVYIVTGIHFFFFFFAKNRVDQIVYKNQLNKLKMCHIHKDSINLKKCVLMSSNGAVDHSVFVYRGKSRHNV